MKLLAALKAYFKIQKPPAMKVLQLPYIPTEPKKKGKKTLKLQVDKESGLRKNKGKTLVHVSDFHRKMLDDIKGKKTLQETVAIAIELLSKSRKG